MGPGPCSYYPPAWSCLWMVIFREIARFDWENLGQPVAATIIAAWWFGTFFYFSIQLGIMIPTDTYKFQRGWNHQPDWYLTILAQRATFLLVKSKVAKDLPISPEGTSPPCRRRGGRAPSSFVRQKKRHRETNRFLRLGISWAHWHHGNSNTMGMGNYMG